MAARSGWRRRASAMAPCSASGGVAGEDEGGAGWAPPGLAESRQAAAATARAENLGRIWILVSEHASRGDSTHVEPGRGLPGAQTEIRCGARR
jgi:hypothetical protein